MRVGLDNSLSFFDSGVGALFSTVTPPSLSSERTIRIESRTTGSLGSSSTGLSAFCSTDSGDSIGSFSSLSSSTGRRLIVGLTLIALLPSSTTFLITTLGEENTRGFSYLGASCGLLSSSEVSFSAPSTVGIAATTGITLVFFSSSEPVPTIRGTAITAGEL